MFIIAVFALGGIAQLGERLHGMQEVSGSIPLTSTKSKKASIDRFLSPSSRGLGHRPFTAITGVRIPVGTPHIDPTVYDTVGFFVFKSFFFNHLHPIVFESVRLLPAYQSYSNGYKSLSNPKGVE